MPTRQVKLEGPGVRGTQVNGPMLRELLDVLIEGSQRALRVRTQGRSTARGTLPAWIAAATEFSVRIREGSTVLEISAPTLAEAYPEEFQQGHLFPEIDPSRAAFDYFVESVGAATEGEGHSKLYDRQFLQYLGHLDGVFGHGVTNVDFQASNRLVSVTPPALRRFREIEATIPRPQRVNIAGKLDTIRHSDKTFTLLVAGEQIRGVTEHADLQPCWGEQVLISGTAHFTSSGQVQRVEADMIRKASDEELQLFESTPAPIGARMDSPQIARAQGPRSGLNAIFGKWPGSESDAEIWEALDNLS
jgi:hypothetical protein